MVQFIGYPGFSNLSVLSLFFEKMHSQRKDFVLLTKYLSQDPVENLFGMVRARGGNNKNPYLIDFLRMTSKLLIKCKNTNCEFEQNSLVTILDLEKYSLPLVNKPVNIFLILLIVLCCIYCICDVSMLNVRIKFITCINILNVSL